MRHETDTARVIREHADRARADFARQRGFYAGAMNPDGSVGRLEPDSEARIATRAVRAGRIHAAFLRRDGGLAAARREAVAS